MENSAENIKYVDSSGNNRKNSANRRQIPENVVAVMDLFPYDDYYEATLECLHNGELYGDERFRRKCALLNCWLSQAIQYFVNRYYRLSIRLTKKILRRRWRLVLSRHDDTLNEKLELIKFHGNLLLAMNYYRKYEDKSAVKRLKKCLKTQHHDALAQLIEQLKNRS